MSRHPTAIDVDLSQFKLLPCPKCKSKAEWVRPMGNRIYGLAAPYYGVDHFRVVCSADSQECGACVAGTSEITATMAALQWNKRA